MIGTSTQNGWYVYGVLPADVDPALFASAPGVDRAPVDVVAQAGLSALVSAVPLDEFDDEALVRNLELPAWLEQQARAHDDVLGRAVGLTPLVPLRFGTVYRSEKRVRAMLEDRAAEFRATLDRLSGRVELGVKAFQGTADTPSDEDAAPSSGRDYLVRRQRALALAAGAAEASRRTVGAVHERLASIADDARANPPQHPELTGRSEPMLLNGAYLVRVDRQEAFFAAVEELRGQDGLELDITGPWPPYNFVDETP